MNLISDRTTKILPYWNRRILTFEDGLAYSKTCGIITKETDLIDDLGEYRVYKNRPFILLNQFLTERYKPWVFWHEIGHHLFHTPATCQFSLPYTRRKIEIEANIVASIALMPLWLCMSKPFWEIEEEYGYPREIIKFRKKILDDYKNQY